MGISASTVAKLLGVYELKEHVNYTPYSFTDTTVLLGAPASAIVGLDYVSARYANPQIKKFQSLTGSGVFASNVNTAGVIELGLLPGSLSQGLIEIMQLAGIPYPIVISDMSSGGTSSVVATACQSIVTPEWRREALLGLSVYTFETTRMLINHGIRLPLVVT